MVLLARIYYPEGYDSDVLDGFAQFATGLEEFFGCHFFEKYQTAGRPNKAARMVVEPLSTKAGLDLAILPDLNPLG